ncbi:YdcF family protein [Roseospira marina]|nr:YdcF family protein [Roseospira marina]MBB4312462.1 uncharacterized SAM-binding protein YcdF (DUF218 family) [Roseospira marina]MBB5085522.1 uncharacterized SAM-binding protein YcdF (DUF218 family) [Roseospira marina]
MRYLRNDESVMVIALGAAVRTDGSVSPAMRRRVALAARTVLAWPHARLVVSGGYGKRHPPGVPPEAHLMAELAREAGVPSDRLVLEAESGDTLGNARHALDLVAGADPMPGRIVVVTDAPHLRRALWCFRRVARGRGLTVTIDGLGAPITDHRARRSAQFWEILALLVYLPRLWRVRRVVTAPVPGHDDAGTAAVGPQDRHHRKDETPP